MKTADVKLIIKYLTTLRDKTGREQEEVDFPQGSTLREVADWLNERYAVAVPDPGVMAILNGRGWEQLPAKLATQIKEGDVICLFPPISGG